MGKVLKCRFTCLIYTTGLYSITACLYVWLLTQVREKAKKIN